MKKHIMIVALAFLGTTLAAQGIEFHKGDWDSAVKQAAKEKKGIFVDAYAVWCGPCKWMAKTTFPDEKVGKFFNDNFISVKMDMEKGEGIDLAKKWDVKAYPTLLFFDSNGNKTHRASGAQDVDGFIALGNDAMDPEKQVFTQAQKYADGERDPQFLYNHAMALNVAYLPVKEVAEAYMATQKDDDWTTKENWLFIRSMVRTSDHSLFKKIIDNRDAFEKVAGEELDIYVNQVLTQDIIGVMRSKSEDDLKALKKKYKEMVPKDAAALGAKADYMFYRMDKDKGPKAAENYFDNYCDNWNELNSAAWDYYEKQDDKKKLEKALSWAEKSIKMEENWYNTDTKANLLAKLGRTKEAAEMAQRSVEVGQAAGEDTKETEDLLKKLQEELQ